MERMERLLFEASVEGSVASLLVLLQQDQLILDRVVALSFYDDTPLHVASMLGHIEFVKVILARKPELAMEFNSQKYLPLHIASAKGHLEIVKALVSANPETCLVHDRDGRNPLHLAAIKGRDQVLKELMRARPHAARAMVQHGETILHLCVRHNQLESLKFLVEAVGDHEFVNSKDVDGNTILHLVVADKQLETVNFLLLNTTIEANATNANGDTAMDVLAQGRRDVKDIQIIQSLRRIGASEAKTKSSSRQVPINVQRDRILSDLTYHEKLLGAPNSKKHVNNHDDWLERKRSTLMVVASLIATMAFQAGVTPPNGVWQEDLTVDLQGNPVKEPHQAGYSVMATKSLSDYNIFLVCNTVGFVSSLSIILLLISGLPFFKRRFFMWILMFIMWMATTAMSLTYLVSIIVLTPKPDQTFENVVGCIVLVWMGSMALLLFGHTIRLILKAMRKCFKLIFRTRRSS